MVNSIDTIELMLRQFAVKFAVRWAVCCLGLWIAAALLGPERMTMEDGWKTIVIAGLFLALVNMAIKPLLVILSFPAIILTLGLFMLVLNGFLIMIVHWLYGPFYIKNFLSAVAAGIIIGLVNFLTTKALEDI